MEQLSVPRDAFLWEKWQKKRPPQLRRSVEMLFSGGELEIPFPLMFFGIHQFGLPGIGVFQWVSTLVPGTLDRSFGPAGWPGENPLLEQVNAPVVAGDARELEGNLFTINHLGHPVGRSQVAGEFDGVNKSVFVVGDHIPTIVGYVVHSAKTVFQFNVGQDFAALIGFSVFVIKAGNGITDKEVPLLTPGIGNNGGAEFTTAIVNREAALFDFVDDVFDGCVHTAFGSNNAIIIDSGDDQNSFRVFSIKVVGFPGSNATRCFPAFGSAVVFTNCFPGGALFGFTGCGYNYRENTGTRIAFFGGPCPVVVAFGDGQ